MVLFDDESLNYCKFDTIVVVNNSQNLATNVQTNMEQEIWAIASVGRLYCSEKNTL